MARTGARQRFPLMVGVIGALLSFVAAKWHLAGLGNDATSYVAIADRFARSGRLGYFLEPKLALWPPGWPVTLGAFRWAFDLSPATTALWINALCLIPIAFEVDWLLRRCVQSEWLIRVGILIAVLGPATLSQSYMVQTETTFVALVLAGFIALIKFSDTRRMSWFITAALVQWVAFLDRYVGLVSIGACALWLCFERGAAPGGRLRRAIGFFVLAASVPGLWILRNWIVTDSMFGPRDTPIATVRRNLIDAATSAGQYLHGYSQYEPLTGIGRLLSLALAALVGVLAVVLMRRAMARRDARPDAWSRPPTGLGDLLGHPVGLLVIFGVAHWLYMIYSASTIAFDPVNTRYLVPMFIPMLIAGLALVDHGALAQVNIAGVGGDRITKLCSIGIVVLLVCQLGVGLVRVSASYWTDKAQGYNSPKALAVRNSPVLANVPDDCTLYANFPELMYLAGFEAARSPRITKFASSDRLAELEHLEQATRAGHDSCLIWVDDGKFSTPSYQYQLDDLKRALELETVARDGNVAVYRVTGVR